MMIQLKTVLVTALAAAAIWSAPAAQAAEESTESAHIAGKAKSKNDYPLDTCIVSGDKLGEKGMKPVVYNHEGREVKFCCSSCIDDFKADPAKYLKKLDDAVISKEKASYPLKTCVVSGQELGKMGAVDEFVYKNHLVRFCCPGCKATFLKDPDKYLAMIHDASSKKASPAKESKAVEKN